MNGPALDIITSAAIFRGELQKMLLAAGIVLLILFVFWAIQEWGLRKTKGVLGWLGILCLGIVGFGAASLITLGIL
jgi:hypothetical protein